MSVVQNLGLSGSFLALSVCCQAQLTESGFGAKGKIIPFAFSSPAWWYLEVFGLHVWKMSELKCLLPFCKLLLMAQGPWAYVILLYLNCEFVLVLNNTHLSLFILLNSLPFSFHLCSSAWHFLICNLEYFMASSARWFTCCFFLNVN